MRDTIFRLLAALAPLAIILANFVPGILGFFAIADWFGGEILGFIGSFVFVSFLPTLASPVAVYAAIVAWDWPWYGAVLVFMWPLVLTLTGISAFSIFTAFKINKIKKDRLFDEEETDGPIIDVEAKNKKEP